MSTYRQLNVQPPPKEKEWHTRMLHLEESWAAKCGEIFSYIVSQHRPLNGSCMQCGCESACISCADCASWSSYLCFACDYLVHKIQPFHRRSTSVISGFNEMLPSNKFLNASCTELVEKSKLVSITFPVVAYIE